MREVVPRLEADRVLGPEIEGMAAAVQGGEVWGVGDGREEGMGNREQGIAQLKSKKGGKFSIKGSCGSGFLEA